MRHSLLTPAVFMLSALLGGPAVVHAMLPSVAVAQQQPSTSASPNTGADMKPIIDRMEKRLSTNVSGTPDRQYVAAIAALSPAIVAACKQEIRVGSGADVRATAQKILTIEQENEAFLREYERTFNVDHSP